MPGHVTRCQGCGSPDLVWAWSMGYLPAVNDLPLWEEAPAYPVTTYPADVMCCPKCSLLQLGYVPDEQVMFPGGYPYRTRMTQALKDNFKDLANYLESRGLEPGSLVVDVGSNDGTLLQEFKTRGHRVVGVEPTGAALDARAAGVETLMAFFGVESAAKLKLMVGFADVIVTTNVFAHMEDVSKFMLGVDALLKEDGMFVVEVHYVGGILDGMQVDTVYHEHLRYYSVSSLNNTVSRHGFVMVAYKFIASHGGSVRAVFKRVRAMTAHPASSREEADQRAVLRVFQDEENEGLVGAFLFGRMSRFSADVRTAQHSLTNVVASVVCSGKALVGVGAPSRATTLVRWAGLESWLPAIYEADDSPKVGRCLAGTRVPIRAERELLASHTENTVALILAWHIAPALIFNLKTKGFKGTALVPLPEPKEYL